MVPHPKKMDIALLFGCSLIVNAAPMFAGAEMSTPDRSDVGNRILGNTIKTHNVA